jgi:RimJ/RimL family protein N-acetyltransferase
LKGGITDNGEESQGREEEGRQEAVTSPVQKKGGGRRPLFTFLPHPAALLPPRHAHQRSISDQIHNRIVAGSIIVRILTPADAERFLEARIAQIELELNAFAESPGEVRAKTPAMIADRLSAPRDEAFVLGAFAEDQLVGTAGYFRRAEAKTRHKGHVWGVFVAPAFRGNGLGRELMQALLAEARRVDGLEQLDLSVAVTQPAARRLYESLGFSVYGREPRALKVGDGYVDEDLMLLRLTPNH